MNYRELLKKYIQWIVENEGESFIDAAETRSAMPYKAESRYETDFTRFSAEEIAEMKAIKSEIER